MTQSLLKQEMAILEFAQFVQCKCTEQLILSIGDTKLEQLYQSVHLVPPCAL